MKKTNVVRILDRQKTEYRLFDYTVDESDLSAETVAKKIGQEIACVFKTLVLKGDKTGVIVAVIPGNTEVDLKALAVLSKNKKCALAPMKEILALTGYIRGGVSPIGMKKKYPTFIDKTILNHDKIFFSAGIRGTQVEISPGDLIQITQAVSGSFSC
jgi:Cys-tRNA(Pro)/Cys-tRNA(Cys) deacylase